MVEGIWEYRPDGKLIWAKKISSKVVVGTEAGTLTPSGYVRVTAFGEKVQAHRIIWEMHNGPVPEGKVLDHINRVRSDNRIENLRLADSTENSSNTTRGANRNCYWNERVQMWQVRVQSRNRLVHAGRYFKSLDEARAAAEQLRQEVHGEFCTVL